MILYKRILNTLLLVCLLFNSSVFAQHSQNPKNIRKGVILAGNVGTSFLATEIHKDFSGLTNDFSNQLGTNFGFELSHFLSRKFEFGGSLSYSYLNGHTDNEDLLAWKHMAQLKELDPAPLDYKTRVMGPEMFGRYYIRRKMPRSKTMNLFIKGGIGLLFYDSELYITSEDGREMVYGKALTSSGKKNTSLTTMVYKFGGGINYLITPQISFRLAANLNMVGYDFLDHLHNYSKNSDLEDKRHDVIGVYTDITAGLAFFIGWYDRTTVYSRRSKPEPTPHLPFAR